MTTYQERAAQKARDFERATSLLPPDVYWGHPINSVMVLAIAEAATARQASELADLRMKLDTAYAVVIDLGGEVREPEFEEQRRLRADAELYRYLKPRMIGADFDWNGNGISALVFEWPRAAAIGGDLDENILAAKEQQA